MGKQRMTAVDIAAEVACLKGKLLGCRVANVYDINPKVLRSIALQGRVDFWRCLGSAPSSISQFRVHDLEFPCIIMPYAQTYIVKLARSSGIAASGEAEKHLLLLESGMRFHVTHFARWVVLYVDSL